MHFGPSVLFRGEVNVTDCHGLTERLSDLGDRTRAQLIELARDPSRDRCDWMIRALADASTVIRRLQTQLERGDPPSC